MFIFSYIYIYQPYIAVYTDRLGLFPLRLNPSRFSSKYHPFSISIRYIYQLAAGSLNQDWVLIGQQELEPTNRRNPAPNIAVEVIHPDILQSGRLCFEKLEFF